jgi:7-cyano-7-deazaguanine synthase
MEGGALAWSSGVHGVVLLSGGLDSATVLAIARADGWRVHALSVDYGQRNAAELDAARAVAAAAGVEEHVVVSVDLRAFGGSALTAEIEVPRHREDGEGVPITYVPARNTVLLSLALAFAEVTESDAIFIGVNAVDYSGYPDCRPEYVEAYERMANLATRRGVEGHPLRVHTPLIGLSKPEIVRRGTELGVDYALTRSCYDLSPAGEACGECDACYLRLKGFADAGLSDPAPYRS